MNSNKKAVAAILVMAFTSQTMFITPQAVAGTDGSPKISYKQLLGSQEGNADVIINEMRDHQVRVDSGAMNARDSLVVMTNSIAEKEVSVADIDAYAQSQKTPAEYRKFKKAVSNTLANVNPSSVSAKELGDVLALAANNSSQEGLTWSGCGGLGGGVVLVIAAVVVGVIAIIKSRGVTKIHHIYSEKRTTRTETYNSKVFEYNHKSSVLQADISSNNSHISTNTQLIAEDNAKIYGATSNPSCASDPVCQHNIQMWSADAIKLGNDNQSYVAKINQDNLEIANWNNPVYLQGQLTLLQQSYQSDMTEYDMEETTDVSMVPQRQALGRALGIGAAIGGAIGIYFIIDGAHDC